MKIELKSKQDSVYKKLCSSASETHSDSELIVPDTLEDILRILCCRWQCRIREKTVSQDAVLVSGEIDITVMYIPETGDGVRVVGTTAAFELSFDAPGADSTSLAVTKLLSLTADAKAVNPRKISVSTNIVMEQSCYKYVDICWAEPPAEARDKLFFKTQELKCRSIELVSEKTLSIEDELDLPEELHGGDFVKAFSSVRLDGSEVVGTKLIVKGTAEIEALCLVSGMPRTASFSLPFSQLFELPDGCLEPEVSAFAMITGQYFEAFDDKLSADIRAAIQIVCLQERSIRYISDAYSCKKQLGLTRSELRCLTKDEQKSQTRSVRLSYNSDYGAEEILFSSAYTSCAAVGENDVNIPVTADIVYKDREGELRACRVRGKVQFELGSDRSPDEAYVTSVSINASAAGDGINADISVMLAMRYLSYDSVGMISEVEETELDREKTEASLYMCRCTDGDLWSLAKKYGSDVELIKLINEIDGTIDDRLLLIPVI